MTTLQDNFTDSALHDSHVQAFEAHEDLIAYAEQYSNVIVAQYAGRFNITTDSGPEGGTLRLHVSLREFGTPPPAEEVKIALAHELEKQGLIIEDSYTKQAWVKGTYPTTPYSTMQEKIFENQYSEVFGTVKAEDQARGQDFLKNHVVGFSFSPDIHDVNTIADSYKKVLETVGWSSTPSQTLSKPDCAMLARRLEKIALELADGDKDLAFQALTHLSKTYAVETPAQPPDLTYP